MKFLLFLIVLVGCQTRFLFADPVTDNYHAGVNLYNQGKYQESITLLQKTVQTNSNSWQVYQILAYDYIKLRDFSNATSNGDKSLALNPDNPTLKALDDKLKTLVTPTPNATLVPTAPSPTPSSTEALKQTSDQKSSIYFSFGGVLPLSPTSFTGTWANGYNFDLGYGLQVAPQLSLILDGSGAFFPVNKSNFPALFIAGGEIYDWMILVNGKYNFDLNDVSFSPYFIIGAGLSVYQSEDRIVTDTTYFVTNNLPASYEVNLGLRGGLGADFKISNSNYLFVEADAVNALGINNLLYFLGRLGLKTDL